MTARLSDLFANGAIVALHATGWPGLARIMPADLDIPDTQETRKALVLGQHRLVEPAALRPVKAAARKAEAAIDSRSMPFRTVPGARYVPDDRLEELSRELSQCKIEWQVEVTRLVGAFPELRREQEIVLRAALQAILPSTDAVDKAMARLASQYPTAEQLRGRFTLTWYVYALESVDKGILSALADEGAQVQSIVRGMVEDLRAQVLERLGAVTELVTKGGKLNARSIAAARETLDRVRRLNVLGDAALEAQAVAFLRVLDRIETAKDAGDEVTPGMLGLDGIRAGLAEGLEQAVAEAEEGLAGMGRRKLAIA